MIKMSETSKLFLETHLPGLLNVETKTDILDSLYELIDEKGFAPPHYDSYNDFGREAQRVYDDIFYSN